jgi:polysaccharide deacetylase family protein (PEP-CTERM system associated)
MKSNNIFTIDLEDWFHAYPVNLWEKLEGRIEEPLFRLLNLLDSYNYKATFFIVGYIADKYKELVKEISKRGHDFGTHSYYHKGVWNQTKYEFEKDLVKSLESIYNCIGTNIDKFRAPEFSICPERTPWIWDILIKNGIKYDSSISPKNFYFPNIQTKKSFSFPFIIETKGNIIYEFPVSHIKLFGLKWIALGGTTFRLFNNKLIKYYIKKCYEKNDLPFIFYIHPRDYDIKLPDIKILKGLKKKFLYLNLKNSFGKTKKLFDYFTFTSLQDYINEMTNENIPIYSF